MTIINQLEQSVTPAVLGADTNDSADVAAVSLLEQFYALLITRLAIPAVYTQLLRANSDTTESNTLSNTATLFERTWQDGSQRQLLINELSATHHIDSATTEQLLINAAHLGYQELQTQANGQFLPAFLQNQQAEVRQYLPVWASAAVTPIAAMATDSLSDTSVNNTSINNTSVNNADTAHTPSSIHASSLNTSAADPVAAVNLEKPIASEVSTITSDTDFDSSFDQQPSDAIHANPSDHHSDATDVKVWQRQQGNKLLVPILLLALTVTALALLWFLVIQPKYMNTNEPVIAAPVVAAPEAVVPATIPVELIVGVDNSGELYSCSATVGDAALQNALSQALRVSFGEQENLCNLEVQAGVKTTLSNIDMALLPEVLTLLRATPFALLHLQNDSIRLEAPDDILLQRLLIDIRNLLPAMTVNAAAPLPLPDNSEFMDDDGIDAMNGRDDDFEEAFDEGVNTGFDNNTDNRNNMASNRNQEYQQADDGRGDMNNRNNAVSTPSRNNAPPGPISLSELDELAGTDFVSEPLHNARPVDSDIAE